MDTNHDFRIREISHVQCAFHLFRNICSAFYVIFVKSQTVRVATEVHDFQKVKKVLTVENGLEFPALLLGNNLSIFKPNGTTRTK